MELVIDKQGGRMGLHKGTRGSMTIYTTQFLQILFGILNSSSGVLDVAGIQHMMDTMVKSPKFVLMANTLPLYLTIQIYLVDAKADCR